MDVRECILKRRSIRKFKDEDITKDIIKDLLECAMAAPSACNKQPWEFYVIKNDALLEKIKRVGKYTNFNSPCVIIVCGNRERTLSKRDNDFFILILIVSSSFSNFRLGFLPLFDLFSIFFN